MEKKCKKIYDNEELFCYPKDFKVKTEIPQIICLILSMVSVYLAFTAYFVALPLSAIFLTVSTVLHCRRKSDLTYTAIIAYSISLCVSLLIFLINIFVY